MQRQAAAAASAASAMAVAAAAAAASAAADSLSSSDALRAKFGAMKPYVWEDCLGQSRSRWYMQTGQNYALVSRYS